MSIDDKIQQAAAAKTKKKKLIILGVLLLILLIAIAAVLYYLFRKKPITAVISGRGSKAVYMRSIDAGFDWPIGIAVNKNGSRVYVVDSNNRLVKSFNAGGQEVGSFGKVSSGKGGAEGFMNPLYVAVSPLSGDVYVTDRSTASVSIYSANGEAKDKFVPKTDDKNFAWSPLGIAFDAKGNLYVSDATKGSHRILIFDENGKLKIKFGKEGTANGEFEYPNGICVDADGIIYVADTNNSRVQVFDKTGKFKRTIGKTGKNNVGHPVGIAFDGNGRLNVVDTFGHTVMVYDKKGQFIYNFGSYGNKDGKFMFPMGLAAYKNNIYVVDREGKRIQVWEY